MSKRNGILLNFVPVFFKIVLSSKMVSVLQKSCVCLFCQLWIFITIAEKQNMSLYI